MDTTAEAPRTNVQAPRAGRGRPREFDADEVVESLTDLFWSKGFEATSMADIVEATGLNKSSLYNAFGSKDDMFSVAMNNYVDHRSGMLLQHLENGERGLDDVLMMFEIFWMEVENGDHRGCFAVNMSTERGPTDDTAVEVSAQYRAMMRDALRAALQRAEGLGEIELGRALTYANVITPVLLGLAVIVRGGADAAEISAHLDAARAVIDGWRVSD